MFYSSASEKAAERHAMHLKRQVYNDVSNKPPLNRGTAAHAHAIRTHPYTFSRSLSFSSIFCRRLKSDHSAKTCASGHVRADSRSKRSP